MSAPPLVEAKGLHTFYGPSHILHGVDFHVAPGETVALMGRNGMGKTTLLRSLMGLTPPSRGEVRIEGHGDDRRQAASRRPRRASRFVPEGRGIFHNLTVREHLVLAAHAPRDGRAAWQLDRVLAALSAARRAALPSRHAALGRRAADADRSAARS